MINNNVNEDVNGKNKNNVNDYSINISHPLNN